MTELFKERKERHLLKQKTWSWAPGLADRRGRIQRQNQRHGAEYDVVRGFCEALVLVKFQVLVLPMGNTSVI